MMHFGTWIFGLVHLGIFVCHVQCEPEPSAKITADGYFECATPTENLGLKTFVYCPLIANTACFEDCLALNTCSSGAWPRNCIPRDMTGRCSKRLDTKNGQTVTSIRIDKNNPTTYGTWSCEYRGVKSKEVDLVQFVAPATSTSTSLSTTTTSTSTQSTTVAVASNNVSIAELSPLDSKNEQSSYNAAQAIIPAMMMEPVAFVALVVLLTISILLNIVFCARCALLKCYMDAKRRESQNEGCLSSILCMPGEEPRSRRIHKDQESAQLMHTSAMSNGMHHMPLLSYAGPSPHGTYVFTADSVNAVHGHVQYATLVKPHLSTYHHRESLPAAGALDAQILLPPGTSQSAMVYGSVPQTPFADLHSYTGLQQTIYDDVASTTNTLQLTPHEIDCSTRRYVSLMQQNPADHQMMEGVYSSDSMLRAYGARELSVDQPLTLAPHENFIDFDQPNRELVEEDEQESEEILDESSISQNHLNYNPTLRCQSPLRRLSQDSISEMQKSYQAKQLLDAASNLLEQAELAISK